MATYYSATYSTNLYLAHHGIKGMHWGIRRYQNPDGSLTPEGQKRYARQNLKRAKLRNFDKWGLDRNHNVLYVIGASGSGKSTTALGLADENDSVIHLDTLFENTAQRTSARNREFEEYCMAKGIDVPKLRDANVSKNERRAIIKSVGDQIEPYGRHCYNEGHRVVVEGVQLADDTIFPDKRYFKTRPTITLHTSKLESSYRAATRDNTQIKDIFKDMTNKERAEWYDSIERHIREIEQLDDLGHDEIHSDKAFDTRTYLSHHGIKGQKWGVRRYQDYDGSLTLKGRERYGKKDTIENNKKSKIQQVLKYNKLYYSPAWEQEFRMRYGTPNRYDPEGLGDGILVNKNMTLTDRGLKEFKKAYDFRYSKEGSEAHKDKDTELLDKIIETGTIPKDTIIYRRSSNLNEPLDKHRKYVSLIPRDTNDFADIIDEGSKVATITYKAKKDLTIAPEQEVQDYIFSKMPKKEAEIYKNIRDGANFIRTNNKTVWYKEDPASIAILSDKYLDHLDYKMAEIYAAGMNWNKYSNNNDVIDHFSKLGYDAIPDVVDGMYRTNTFSNNLNMPIGSAIILNPKETLTQKSKKVETMGHWTWM